MSIAVWVLTLIYVGGLAHLSQGALRVPHRAQRADWDYSYGFYTPEATGTADDFRWASRHAVAVVPPTDRRIEVTAWTHPPDIGERPVDLKVWIDGVPLLDSRRDGGESITAGAVRIPDGQTRTPVVPRRGHRRGVAGIPAFGVRSGRVRRD